jgi:glutathione peroxidase
MLLRASLSALPVVAAALAIGAAAFAGGAEAAGQPDGGRAAAAAATPAACPQILDRRLRRLQDDAPQDLCQYAGKVVLVVNTASRCGYTGQYEDLEAMQRRYGGRGLVVLGFPSNDFGQEPGSNAEIAAFCFDTYGVAFPMFARGSVVGPDADPLFVELARQTGAPPKWNFHKYLVGRDGSVLAAYPGSTRPLSARVTRDVEQALRR